MMPSTVSFCRYLFLCTIMVTQEGNRVCTIRQIIISHRSITSRRSRVLFPFHKAIPRKARPRFRATSHKIRRAGRVHLHSRLRTTLLALFRRVRPRFRATSRKIRAGRVHRATIRPLLPTRASLSPTSRPDSSALSAIKDIRPDRARRGYGTGISDRRRGCRSESAAARSS